MELLRLVGLCMLGLAPLTLLRKNAPEQALVLTVGLAAVGLGWCMTYLAPLLSELERITVRAGLAEAHMGILVKAVGVAVVTKLGVELCTDGGSRTLAAVLSLFGAAASLSVAMPLVREVLRLLLGFWE